MTGFNSKRQMAADKLQEPWNEDEWRRNNWRCVHGWLRGEQCEICNAAQPVQEPVAWNKNIRDKVDLLLAEAGYQPDSSARNALSMMNFDTPPLPVQRQPLTDEQICLAWLGINDPVALGGVFKDGEHIKQFVRKIEAAHNIGDKLYTAPPQREWAGLNEKERNDIEDDFYANISIHVFDAIEAKLKEKNT